MEVVQSFAPLVARLAARADEIRPVDGAEVSWANVMALFLCAIYQMLILLCEALDARAAADIRAVSAPALRQGAARSGRVTMPIAARAPRLAPVPDIPVKPGGAPSAMSGPVYNGPWLASTGHPAPVRVVASRIAIPPKRAGLRPAIKHVQFVAIS